MKNKKWFFVQLVSLSRPILAVLFIFNIYKNLETKYFILFLVFFSDFLDGFLAKKWKVCSRFGSIFDPVCDKVSIYILFSLININEHRFLFYTLIIKDLTVFLGGLYSQKIWKTSIYTQIGRSTMVFTSLYLIMYNLSIDFPQIKFSIIYIRLLTNICFIIYIGQYLSMLGGILCKKKI